MRRYARRPEMGKLGLVALQNGWGLILLSGIMLLIIAVICIPFFNYVPVSSGSILRDYSIVQQDIAVLLTLTIFILPFLPWVILASLKRFSHLHDECYFGLKVNIVVVALLAMIFSTLAWLSRICPYLFFP